MTAPERPTEKEDPPPFGGSWRRIYAAVVVYTVILVLALYWMTVSLNR